MAYFNPIVYFIKSFIRLFTRKFFWVLLIMILLFLVFVIFNNNGVFAESIYSLNDNYFSDSDIDNAESKVNSISSDIWDNKDYDIFIYYKAGWWSKIVCFYNVRNYVNHYGYDLVYKIDNIYTTDGVKSCGIALYDNSSTSDDSGCNYPTIGGIYEISGNKKENYNNPSVAYFNPTITSDNKINLLPIRSHFDIYDNLGNKVADRNSFFAPYFMTTHEELETFDFDYLQINGGTTKYTSYFEPLDQTYTAEFKLTYNYKGVTTNIDILPEYVAVNRQNNTWQINIPFNVLTNKVIVRNGEKFYYTFSYKNGYESGYELFTGELTYDLTTEQEEEINADSEKQLQGQILESQQNIDNTLNNSNIDDITSDTLPSDSTQDITADGVNGIFTSIYNAFCTGTAQDIVFPIPFTNKNITLQANYVNNMLSSNGAGWVVTIIQAFWWYLISRFIIKDVMNKINKIKSGNIEDIETTNIRGDML